MSEESQRADIRHIHRQMKAVCSLIQPEYKTTFNRVMKFLELQLLLQDLTREDPHRFQASSISSEEHDRKPFSLADFIKAVAPVCNENERAFLRSLQNTEQTMRMFEQVKQFQNYSKEVRPEDLMMQFMTPGQQKTFKEFDHLYSKQELKNQEVPHGSS